MFKKMKTAKSYLGLALMTAMIGFGLGADAGTQQKPFDQSKKIQVGLLAFEELPSSKNQDERFKNEDDQFLKVDYSNAGAGLTKQLALSLEKTGKFSIHQVFSPKEKTSIVKELQEVKKQQVPEGQILIQGKVLEYKPFRISPSNTTRLSSVSIREKDPTARVVLEISMVDVVANETIDLKKMIGEVRADEVSTAGIRRGLTFNLSGNLTTVSLERASSLAIQKTMDWIQGQLSFWPWRAKIDEVTESGIMFKGDESLGFKIGDHLKVYRITEKVKPQDKSKFIPITELKIIGFEKGQIKAENLGQTKPSVEDFVEYIK